MSVLALGAQARKFQIMGVYGIARFFFGVGNQGLNAGAMQLLHAIATLAHQHMVAMMG